MILAAAPKIPWQHAELLPPLPDPAATSPEPVRGRDARLHIGRLWDEDDPEFDRMYAERRDQVDAGSDFRRAVAAAALLAEEAYQPQAVLQAADGSYLVSPLSGDTYGIETLRSWRAKPASEDVKALVDEQYWIDFTDPRP